MKLRNKKTGEIVDFQGITMFKHPSGNWAGSYKKLSELNEKWEDYQEPEEFYWIDYDGKVKTFIDLYEWQDKMKEIGNYFETKEEAEKAVEKLKAWKRLKDNGFRFKTYMRNPQGTYDVFAIWKDQIPPSSSDISQDLNLLFGGKE